MKRWIWTVLAVLLVAAPAWADCPLDLGHGTGTVIYSDRYMIALRPDPFRIEVGMPFALLLNVCTKGGDVAELVRIDAATDEHRHGMDHAPTIEALGDGRYRVEGMLFSRQGSWEVSFDVRGNGEEQQLTHDFVVR